jgi:hypothetical protein
MERKRSRRGPGVSVEAVARRTSGQKDWSCGDEEPEQGAVLEFEFVAFGELREGGNGDGEVGRHADVHASEPFSGDAHDGEGTAFDADLFADDIGRATEAALPKGVAEDDDLGRVAAGGIGIGGNEETAEKRSNAKFGVAVAGDAGEVVAGKSAVGFHIPHATSAPADKAGEDALVAFELAKHGIREGDFGVGASGGELDEAFRVADREVAEEEGVDQREDGGVGADAEGEREDGDGGEDGALG